MELSGRVEEAEEERQTERQARLRADNQRADLTRQAVMYCTFNLYKSTQNRAANIQSRRS